MEKDDMSESLLASEVEYQFGQGVQSPSNFLPFSPQKNKHVHLPMDVIVKDSSAAALYYTSLAAVTDAEKVPAQQSGSNIDLFFTPEPRNSSISPKNRMKRYPSTHTMPSHAENSLYQNKFDDEEWKKLSTFESLDYQATHNDMYNVDIKSMTEYDYKVDDVQRWMICFLIGLVTGIFAFLVHYCVDIIQESKFHLVYTEIKASSYAAAWIEYTLLNVGIALVGTLLIIFVSPAANSSGIPFVKAYLNGAKIPKAFNIKTLFVKVIGAISCVSTALPVGPEGPMIHIGGIIGGGVSQSKSKTLGCELHFLRKFHNDHDRRDYIAMGAACGVASAFGAPAGGLLFAMEEAASFWSSSLTWRTFFACMTATFISNFLTNGISSVSWGKLNLDELIVFNIDGTLSYALWELFPFALLGIFGGLMGALFTKLNVFMTRMRSKYVVTHKFRRILEVVVIVSLWSSLVFLLPSLSSCSPYTPNPTEGSSIPDVIEGIGKWGCPEGSFNSLATLLFTAQGGTFRLLLHTGSGYTFDYISLCVFTLIYFIGAAMFAGSTMASGLMVPMLIIGAGYGRIVGKLIKTMVPTIDPASYALVGATSFFGGVSRMTISLTVIMLEITNDLHFLLPIMISAMLSKWIGDYFTHPLYDLLIGAQRMPFLESEPSKLFNILTVSDVMSRNVVTLPSFVSVGHLIETLKTNSHNGFPVVADSKSFRGLVLRDHLLVLLHRKSWIDGIRLSHLDFENLSQRIQHITIDSIDLTPEDMECYIDLKPYLNKSQFTVQTGFALDVAFRLFRSMGLRHLPVVNQNNEVAGMITRKDLLEPVVEHKHEQLLSYHKLQRNSSGDVPVESYSDISGAGSFYHEQ